ncbi:MAG: hypothetical protein ACLR23_01215 [Clostridia bacterium]
MRYGCNSAVGVINCGLPDFQGMMEILIPKGSIKKFIQLILGIAF